MRELKACLIDGIGRNVRHISQRERVVVIRNDRAPAHSIQAADVTRIWTDNFVQVISQRRAIRVPWTEVSSRKETGPVIASRIGAGVEIEHRSVCRSYRHNPRSVQILSLEIRK